jgi:hypothetical protein
MSKHLKPKAKRKPSISVAPKDGSPSPEKVTRAVVEAVIEQVAAAFTPDE